MVQLREDALSATTTTSNDNNKNHNDNDNDNNKNDNDNDSNNDITNKRKQGQISEERGKLTMQVLLLR